ncbi:hypothetical protein [Paenirhodobacter enshiensis]|uniref:Flagellar biosynthesis protein FlgN n=1 Tax=Paenirhodobacter enshiensis TaxID=1105367 RepID=A0A086Y3I8_9RHOB|nr:hypothetical protein [Paenirhodobacter enshiensis]KFI28838.1 hypothetical protein CG50_11515 [Paenirhodobacter enshiensis]
MTSHVAAPDPAAEDPRLLALRDLLNDERIAIRTGDFARLGDLVARKEKAMADMQALPASRIPALRSRIEENQRLIEAALNGFRSARSRIEQIAASVRSCTTYDRNGQSQQISLDSPAIERRA